MLLDMSKLLGGVVNTLSFSYTLSADRVLYQAESGSDTEESPRITEADDGDELSCRPIVFDDVVVTAPVTVEGTVVNRSGYIVLTETAGISYRTRCARCLADVEDTLCSKPKKM